MSYEFKKLGEVEALTEIPENANAIVEVDGAIKRVPGDAFGKGPLVILEETELSLTDGALLSPSTAELDHYPEIGKTYAVTINGTGYSAYAISGAKTGMGEMTDTALLVPAVALIYPVKPNMIETVGTNLAVSGVTEELRAAESCTISIAEEGELKPLVVNATSKTEATAPTGAKAAYTLTLDKDYDEINLAFATGQATMLIVNTVFTPDDTVVMQAVLDTVDNGMHFHAQANGYDFEATVVNNDNVTLVVREVSAGGGGGIVNATATLDETGTGGTCTIDKNYTEILAACKAGQYVACHMVMNGMVAIANATMYSDDYIWFQGFVEGAVLLSVYVGATGNCQFALQPLMFAE